MDTESSTNQKRDGAHFEANAAKRVKSTSRTITLISKDGHSYTIERYLLMAGSTVFRDMLESVGDDNGDGTTMVLEGTNVQLEESKAVLDLLLPFFRNEHIDTTSLEHHLSDFHFGPGAMKGRQ
ncbi:hypothetical protein T439DRAFT_133792 [Meredithblackwellia eburnea MCA 4105]